MSKDRCYLDLGRMNKRVTLQQQTSGEDISGAAVVWSDFATRDAYFTSTRGSDTWREGQFTSQKYCVVTMRFLPDVTSNMQLKFLNKTFTVQDAVDVDERHIKLEILCVELDGK